jgi:hypothetical protein
MLFLAEDQVSDIRQTARVSHGPWLPINVAMEHRGIKLAVLMHERRAARRTCSRNTPDSAPAVLRSPAPPHDDCSPAGVHPRAPSDHNQRDGGNPTPSRDPVKATIAAQGSPYGLGLRDDDRFASQAQQGSILDRRYGVNSRPALTHVAALAAFAAAAQDRAATVATSACSRPWPTAAEICNPRLCGVRELRAAGRGVAEPESRSESDRRLTPHMRAESEHRGRDCFCRCDGARPTSAMATRGY